MSPGSSLLDALSVGVFQKRSVGDAELSGGVGSLGESREGQRAGNSSSSGAHIALSSALGTRSGVKAQAQCGHYVHGLKLPLFGLSFWFSPRLDSQSVQ